MTKGTKIVLGLILATGIGAVVYLLMKKKEDGTIDTSIPNDSSGGGGSNTGATDSNIMINTTPGTPVLTTSSPKQTTLHPAFGKNAYAKYDGVSVFNKKGNTKNKTAKKGEWLGKVSSVDNSNGIYYIASDTKWVVPKSVDLK